MRCGPRARPAEAEDFVDLLRSRSDDKRLTQTATKLTEGVFASLECELLARRRFQAQAEAKMAVFEFIEGWYNPHRRHSGLGYLSPSHFERRLSMRAVLSTPQQTA